MGLLVIQNLEHKYEATRAQLPKKTERGIIFHKKKTYAIKR